MRFFRGNQNTVKEQAMVGDHVLIWWPAKVFVRKGHLRRDLILEAIVPRARESASRRREQRRSLLCSRSESRSVRLNGERNAGRGGRRAEARSQRALQVMGQSWGFISGPREATGGC